MTISTNKLNKKYGFENPFEADPLVSKALPYIKNSKHVLDIGCGEGADSVFFAKKGFQVDAIDNNELFLSRLQAFITDYELSNITIQHSDVVKYPYPKNYYDAINCLLVGCCMRRSEFEEMLVSIKETVKPNGIIIMSLRNYLDPELEEFCTTSKLIEPNTFEKKEDCCNDRYFIEKDRLKNVFKDFEILYYFEGLVPDKYQKISMHGDSCIICKKIN